MPKIHSSVLPQVLAVLTRQPDLALSVDELCVQVRDIIVEEYIQPLGTLKAAVNLALEAGAHLGILTIKQERACMPLNFWKQKSKQLKAPLISQTTIRKTIKQILQAQQLKRKLANRLTPKTIKGVGKRKRTKNCTTRRQVTKGKQQL